MKKLLIIILLMLIYTNNSFSQTIVQMEKEGGVYKIPCEVNGLRLKLIFDTGASNVCISENVAIMMLENDYLSVNDIQGTSQSVVADGRIVDHTKITLRNIKIGDKVLNNIEAVVIEGQSAPLLLGQSAIKRLGRYTISDNKLIFGSNNNTSYGELTQETENKLFEEAIKYYNNSSYNAALEKFKILYNKNLLSTIGIFEYAECCYYTENTEQALDLYLEVENSIKNDSFKYIDILYYQIGRCLWILNEYDDAIPYLEKAKFYAQKWSERESTIVYIISNIYSKNGKEYESRSNIDKYIREYLSFMDINATDCWNKDYKDKFLGELYGYKQSFCLSSEFDKYMIIAAAWGDEKSQEICKKFNITYNKKPNEYAY